MENKIVTTYPASRLATHDIGVLSRLKHQVTGLVEVDVTHGRKEIKRLIQQGYKISFTSWLVKEISAAIEENPYIHALNTGRRRQVIFSDVNISVPIEKTIDGKKVPIIKLMTETNQKTIQEICSELSESKEKKIVDEQDFTLTSKWYTRFNNIFFHLPRPVRLLIWRLLLISPKAIHNNIGTAIITNGGIIGTTPGWIIPKTIHNLAFGLGSIVKKPRVLNGEIVARDILHLTVIVNHDSVDGLPAAKFTTSLVNSIEKANQLQQFVLAHTL